MTCTVDPARPSIDEAASRHENEGVAVVRTVDRAARRRDTWIFDSNIDRKGCIARASASSFSSRARVHFRARDVRLVPLAIRRRIASHRVARLSCSAMAATPSEQEFVELFQRVQKSCEKAMDGEAAEEERAVDGLTRLKAMAVTTELLVATQVIKALLYVCAGRMALNSVVLGGLLLGFYYVGFMLGFRLGRS